METDSNEFGQEDSEGRIVQDQLQNLIVRKGKDFARFAKTVFNRDSLTEESFVALCNQFLPGQEDQVHDWLYTNAYPENFRLIDSQQQ